MSWRTNWTPEPQPEARRATTARAAIYRVHLRAFLIVVPLGFMVDVPAGVIGCPLE
jgi:hypothetical protein